MSSHPFDLLHLWRDSRPRTGPENMAVDEWLLETSRVPLLRTYEWEGDWISFGYFGPVRDARGMIGNEGGNLVRRATGGGIVDHRIDRTYTLVVPRAHPVATMPGNASYRLVHQALIEAMETVGLEARLIEDDKEVESAACFEKPVTWDVVDDGGRKLAGAGQRRTRAALLHQGSVVVREEAPGLFEAMADRLAERVETVRREPSAEELAALVGKFASREWLERR